VTNGGDELVNGIYVVLLSTVTVRVIPDAGQPRYIRILCAVGWGLSLASRASFFPVFPIVIWAVARRRDWATALRYGAVAATTTAAVTLPFWVYAPQSFTPLEAAGKLTGYGALSPVVGIGMYAAALAAGLLVMRQQGSEDFLLPSIIALGLPLVALTVVLGVVGALDYPWARYEYCDYGLMVLPFAILLVANEASALRPLAGDSSRHWRLP